MNKIELKQPIPGTWSNIDIFVDGVKRFHAGKQGTDFWAIVDVNNPHKTIGYGSGGPSGVKKAVRNFLITEQSTK